MNSILEVLNEETYETKNDKAVPTILLLTVPSDISFAFTFCFFVVFFVLHVFNVLVPVVI